MIDIQIIPLLKDNYAYLLQGKNGDTGIIDPGEAAPVIAALEKRGLTLTHVINTHHHWDHTDGNQALIEKYDCVLVGPAREKQRIPGMNVLLSEGDIFDFGGERVEILETPGHTTGHICYYLPETAAVFTGDTLFLMSTGKLFEGTAEDMWQSLQKLMALPDETRVYCGHEYTLSNGEFCLTVEPENEDLKRRMEKIRSLRAEGKPTMPGTIGEEKKTNAFVRAGSAAGYAKIRALKDQT